MNRRKRVVKPFARTVEHPRKLMERTGIEPASRRITIPDCYQSAPIKAPVEALIAAHRVGGPPIG